MVRKTDTVCYGNANIRHARGELIYHAIAAGVAAAEAGADREGIERAVAGLLADQLSKVQASIGADDDWIIELADGMFAEALAAFDA